MMQSQLDHNTEVQADVDETAAIANHRRACQGFSAIVAQGDGRWSNQSPCPDWDARGVVEHVIGIHDQFLLAPTGTLPERAQDDPAARWAATMSAVASVIDLASAPDREDGTVTSEIDLDQALPALTGELLAHTWDLARAIGVDPELDAQLGEVARDFIQAHEEQVRSSGLFGNAVSVPPDADAVSQFLAIVGRDPYGK